MKMAWKDTPSRRKLIFATGAVLAAGLLLLVIESRRHGNMPSLDPHKQTWTARMEPEPPHLEIKSVAQHGHIYEIVGSAEPGSSVMINGQYVPTFFESSTFEYFIGPLPDGVTVVTITSQNENGGFNTRQVALTIP
jgi:hypothetical protein